MYQICLLINHWRQHIQYKTHAIQQTEHFMHTAMEWLILRTSSACGATEIPNMETLS